MELLPLFLSICDGPLLAHLLLAQAPFRGSDPVVVTGRLGAWNFHLESLAPDADLFKIGAHLVVDLSYSAQACCAVIMATMRDQLRDSLIDV